jgi:hypothetical protein
MFGNARLRSEDLSIFIPTRLRLQQIPQFLRRDTRSAQDRPQRATFEIPIMVGNGNQQPWLCGMPKVVVAPSDMVHKKAGSL